MRGWKIEGRKENGVGGDFELKPTKCFPPKLGGKLERKLFSHANDYFALLITIISYVIRV
jgi:hypothetical protein